MQGAIIYTWTGAIPGRELDSKAVMEASDAFYDQLMAEGKIEGHDWYLSTQGGHNLMIVRGEMDALAGHPRRPGPDGPQHQGRHRDGPPVLGAVRHGRQRAPHGRDLLRDRRPALDPTRSAGPPFADRRPSRRGSVRRFPTAEVDHVRTMGQGRRSHGWRDARGDGRAGGASRRGQFGHSRRPDHRPGRQRQRRRRHVRGDLQAGLRRDDALGHRRVHLRPQRVRPWLGADGCALDGPAHGLEPRRRASCRARRSPPATTSSPRTS